MWCPLPHPKVIALYNSSPTAAHSVPAPMAPLNTPSQLPSMGLCTHCPLGLGCSFPGLGKLPHFLQASAQLPAHLSSLPPTRDVNWRDVRSHPTHPSKAVLAWYSITVFSPLRMGLCGQGQNGLVPCRSSSTGRAHGAHPTDVDESETEWC